MSPRNLLLQPGFAFSAIFLMILMLAGSCIPRPTDSTHSSASTQYSHVPAIDNDAGLIPLDSRWEHPQFINFRPADEGIALVNPPRMSWPYVPETVVRDYYRSEDGSVPFRVFTLQICADGSFTDPEIEVETDINFFNALPVLEPGIWYWRVKTAMKDADEQSPDPQWSTVRTFVIKKDTPEWDRTVISNAAELMARRPRPWFGPADGHWKAFGKRMEADERTREWLELVLQRAEKVKETPWWNDFPDNDRMDGNSYTARNWAVTIESGSIASGLLDAIFAYQVTGDDEYKRAVNYFLKIAGFPPGGQTSPEYFYKGGKAGTNMLPQLALFYDFGYDLLNESERKKILNAIEWRMKAVIEGKYSFHGENGVWRQGIAMTASSHPYENFNLAVQAALLIGNELPVAEKVLNYGLNYVTGVTSVFGADEGWNEGLAYSRKMRDPLDIMMKIAVMLPELQIEKHPILEAWIQWTTHMTPIGIGPLPFGDLASMDPALYRKSSAQYTLQMAFITQNPQIMHRREVLEGVTGNITRFTWPELIVADHFNLPTSSPGEPKNTYLPNAGWVMAASSQPSDVENFKNSTGMIFQSRPQGGRNHSYRAENTFAWYSLGHMLSSPGGSVLFRSPYSNSTMSHNGILINGEGQEWMNPSPYPFAGRLLAYREEGDYVHWVGDATYAYQTVEGLLRAHRHVIFVDEEWFVVYDDLAMRPDAKPAKISFLFHVKPEVKGELDAGQARFRFHMPGGDKEWVTNFRPTKLVQVDALFEKEPVDAEVALANNPDDLEMINLRGRDGFYNPVTGTDMYEITAREQARRSLEPLAMAHNIWATSRKPAHQFHFLSTYTAHYSGERGINIRFPSQHHVEAMYSDGRKRTVSFDPDQPGDIQIDLETYRQFAIATDPNHLPPAGQVNDLAIDSDNYQIEWMYDEKFDNAWMMRWFQEGDALVKVDDGSLHQRRVRPDQPLQSTLWFRPELPQNLAFRARVRVDETAGGNAGNINLILHAREKNGGRLEFRRSGSYPEYHDIPNYIITLVGGDMEAGHNRLRRNPGFDLLVDNQDARSQIGQTYELLVTIVDGRIRYYIDGKKTIDYTDPDPHAAGRMGLRTWNSDIVWEKIEIGRVADVDEGQTAHFN